MLWRTFLGAINSVIVVSQRKVCQHEHDQVGYTRAHITATGTQISPYIFRHVIYVYLEQLCRDGCVGVRCNSCIRTLGSSQEIKYHLRYKKKNIAVYQNMYQVAWITIFSQIQKRSAKNKNYITFESNNNKRKTRLTMLFIIFISVGANDSRHENSAGIYGSSFKFFWRCIWMEQNIWRLWYAGNRYLHSTWQMFFVSLRNQCCCHF